MSTMMKEQESVSGVEGDKPRSEFGITIRGGTYSKGYTGADSQHKYDKPFRRSSCVTAVLIIARTFERSKLPGKIK